MASLRDLFICSLFSFGGPSRSPSGPFFLFLCSRTKEGALFVPRLRAGISVFFDEIKRDVDALLRKSYDFWLVKIFRLVQGLSIA